MNKNMNQLTECKKISNISCEKKVNMGHKGEDRKAEKKTGKFHVLF